jgi:hypothetical protein
MLALAHPFSRNRILAYGLVAHSTATVILTSSLVRLVWSFEQPVLSYTVTEKQRQKPLSM